MSSRLVNTRRLTRQQPHRPARAKGCALASQRSARASAFHGGSFPLAERRPERFTIIVFFRGLHCPVRRAQLRELDRRLDEFSARGI